MAKIFQPKDPNQGPRAICEAKYNAARANLMLLLAFTAINMLLLLINSNTYFLFSALLPYGLVVRGMTLCGKLPDEFYEGGKDAWLFFEDSYLWGMVAVAAVILVLYALTWWMSRNHKVGWLIAATALFVIDTAYMLLFWGVSLDGLLDILFHAWVLYYLIAGIMAYFKWKKLPPDPVPEVIETAETTEVVEKTDAPETKE